jgi:hypothetical protein
MNTQTHVIMGAVLFGRTIPHRAWIAAAGGLIPDIPMFMIVAALKLSGVSDREIFGTLYWQNWWQITNAIGHSFLLWGLVSILAVVMRERISNTLAAIEGWGLVFIFSASALLHAVIDLLCHREDAHMSLWPLTRWKFISPVSYWDDRHYGQYFGVFEAALGLVLAVVLFRRFQNGWVRSILGLAMVLYLAVPTYFILSH